MRLNSLSILNYKNIGEAQMNFAPGVNCLIGNNAMGKTNILDAIYYLSMCKSCTRQPDASVIRHGEQYMMLQGSYTRRDTPEEVTMAVQRGKRKVAKRSGKEYQRLSQHIGLLPLVMVAPADGDLIRGGGDERRRLMDHIISQSNHDYLDAVIRYGKAVEQRNSMIRHQMTDPLLYATVEQVMCQAAQLVYRTRRQWIEQFTPIFMRYYSAVAGEGEKVKLKYESALHDDDMEHLLNQSRQRDMALGYTSQGVHRDDIDLLLDGYSMRRTGSQGQCKTYTIALRLAQFDFLRQSTGITPLLLLDDIFDRLDASRVERIVEVVASDRFGQIFITDTNRTHIDRIVQRLGGDHRLFVVDHGTCTPLNSPQP